MCKACFGVDVVVVVDGPVVAGSVLELRGDDNDGDDDDDDGGGVTTSVFRFKDIGFTGAGA